MTEYSIEWKMNPLYIAHRINTIPELVQVPAEYGVEVDIRDHGDVLVLHHDPFIVGPVTLFEDYLAQFRHAFIILNIKSEGIEFRVLEILKAYDVHNYMFLDSSFPMIMKLHRAGVRDVALRVSEYEHIGSFRDSAYLWVDCFTQFPLSSAEFVAFSESHRLCLVSPELQGHHGDAAFHIIDQMRRVCRGSFMICCKLANIAGYMREFSERT